MGKTITAEKVKKLPIGTEVLVVREGTQQTTLMRIAGYYKKKMLKGATAVHEIRDRAGWHYEVTE